ncbi:MAG: hypothetical protein H6961_08265 [Chromatiaceae bacterium]|nr:hypothetical protein [Chromatiaceae bacterium]
MTHVSFFPRSWVSAVVVTLVLTPSLSSAELTAYPLVIDRSSGSNPFRSVELKQTDNGIVVRGTISKPFHSRHVGFGHIHLDLLDRDGLLLRSKRVDVPGAIHTNRYRHAFTVITKDVPDTTATVHLSSHRGSDHN